MADPIAPCWECSRLKREDWKAGNYQQEPPYYVICLYPSCDISGPERPTPDDAIAAWNAVAALYGWRDTREETPV